MNPVPVPEGAIAGDLLGRDAELARLVALIEADTPTVVVGEAGVGKTSLVRTAVRTAGRRSFEGGGFGTLAWVPFLALERAIGRKLAGGDSAFAAQELLRVVGAGVLFIDDLQWVDPATREALVHVSGRLGLVVAIRRGDPGADTALTELSAGFARLDLDPLGEAEAAELARRVDPRLDAQSARRVARRAGGNPLLVTELASGGEHTATLAAAIRVRLDALDGPARDAMTMLALAGHPMAPVALGPGAGRLATAGLAIVDADGRLSVRHEMIAAAAAEAVGDDERHDMHARLARIVADPGEAAAHHLAAGERHLAHDRAMEAADAAVTPGEQAAHLEVAASAVTGPTAVGLLARAVHALVDARAPVRALAVLRNVRGSTDPVLAYAEARALRENYELGPARVAVERALTAVMTHDPGAIEDIVPLRLESARIAFAEMGTPTAILAEATAAYALARQHEVFTIEAQAVLGEGRILAGDVGGIDDLAAAHAAASAANVLPLVFAIGNRLVFAYLKAGRSADGRALAERLAATAGPLRLAGWEEQMRYWSAGFAWHGGDALAASTISEAMRDAGAAEHGIDWYGIQASADLGRYDEARIRAERTLTDAKGGEYELGEALWLCADVAMLSGRWADAIRYADRHAREVRGAHHRVFVELPGAWASYELGRPATWPAHGAGMPILEGGGIELEALRAMAAGRHIDAAAGFDDAARAWAGRHARGERRSRWGAAESLRLAGHIDEARDRLLALEADLQAAAEIPIAARTRRSLRLVGVRRAAARRLVPRSPLTLRERQILELIATGIGDAQIASRLGISRWAVVRSAESAAAKLGTMSRAEAVVAALAS